MGIKNYLTNLINKFPNIVTKKKINFDILCLDANTILHEVCGRSTNNDEFKKILFNRLDNLISKLRPKKIAIFVDGQAVLAKVKTQIKRRNKYLYNQSNNKIDTLNLTPGTIFSEFIDTIFKEYLQKISIKSYYSSSKENNEGEIKIFQWLKSNTESPVCIVGNDADIILLSLLNTPLLNIYICNNNSFISLFQLIKSLSELSEIKFNFKYHPIRRDIGILSLLSGNDYIDHTANFNHSLVAYESFLKEKKGFITTKNGDINFNNLKHVLGRIKIIDTNLYTQKDSLEYLKSLVWNLKLYTEKIIPNFIPRYNNINLGTIIKFFPSRVNLPNIISEWQHPDVYLLSLMPITGKNLIPQRLQKYMDENSPIFDIFPKPCEECINFKREINLLKTKIDTLEPQEFKLLTSQINENYKTHIKSNHELKDIHFHFKRIKKTLNI